jgi:hypothetical protein
MRRWAKTLTAQGTGYLRVNGAPLDVTTLYERIDFRPSAVSRVQAKSIGRNVIGDRAVVRGLGTASRGVSFRAIDHLVKTNNQLMTQSHFPIATRSS